MRVIRSLGAHDVGQACLVRQGTVLAVEALEGTDRMVRRGAEFGAGAVLVKAAKPGQDMRFDVPVIGPGTLEVARECRLRAIGLEAGRTLVLEQARALALAEAAGIAIVGLERLDARSRPLTRRARDASAHRRRRCRLHGPPARREARDARARGRDRASRASTTSTPRAPARSPASTTCRCSTRSIASRAPPTPPCVAVPTIEHARVAGVLLDAGLDVPGREADRDLARATRAG